MTTITALDSRTQFVDVAGTTLTVTLTHERGQWVATHAPTGAWGHGATEEDALNECARIIAEDRDFYCRTAADWPMAGPLMARKTTYQRLFGMAGKVTA